MGRKLREEIPGQAYHVYCRGNRGGLVFEDDGDCAAFVEKLFELAKKTMVDILAFCLMGNHFHLCVRTRAEGQKLSKFMQRLNLWHARQYNAKHGVRGRLNECRYRAKVVDSEHYLLNLIRYIHLNPVRARRAKSVNEWKFSSHAAYCGGHNPGIEVTEVLRLVGGVEGYLALVADPVVPAEELERFRFPRQRTLPRLALGAPVAPHLQGHFGERVRLAYALKGRGLSNSEIAKRLGCAKSKVAKLLEAAVEAAPPPVPAEQSVCCEEEAVYLQAA